MSSSLRVKAILLGLFLVFALVLASCEERPVVPLELTGPPINAWEGGPPDGSELPLGENRVLCHFFAVAGVASGELWVNGAFANRAVNPDPGATYFTAELTFQATAPGSYVLECVAIDGDGSNARSEPVTVFFTGKLDTPTSSPTATATSTGRPAATPTSTDTPTSTRVPADTPTSTARPIDTPTNTPTSTPTTQTRVVITMFEASKTQIMVGECPVRFTWRVEAPTSIYFDGEPVTNYPDFRDRCPTSTRSYELVANGYLGPVTASITIVVIQPPTDTEGPVITRIGESTDPMSWPDAMCSPDPRPNQVTISARVTDASGVSAVKLTYRVVRGGTQGSWQNLSMTEVQTSSYERTVTPYHLQLSMSQPANAKQAGTLEYYIQAFDGLNNTSQSSTGAVTIAYCYIVT